MLHRSRQTADKFAEEYDRHGDSYTENATIASLKEVFNEVQVQVNRHVIRMLAFNKVQVQVSRHVIRMLAFNKVQVRVSRHVIRHHHHHHHNFVNVSIKFSITANWGHLKEVTINQNYVQDKLRDTCS